MDHFPEFEAKMRAAHASEAAIRAFRHSYSRLTTGRSGRIPEASIQPVDALPRLEQLATDAAPDRALLAQTVIVKLNGGLGTGMGLEAPKSLLVVKDMWTFLDIITHQILYLRKTHGVNLRFLLMNSFSTSAATKDRLRQSPEIGKPEDLELMQNSVPKVDAATLRPAEWPSNLQQEWCPPGHGDLYPSLLGSGWLDRLLSNGIRYLFVSNADNLGATLDLDLLGHFTNSDQPFLMEVCERTAADRKGGHLAQRDGQLLLRESAQCPDRDKTSFQDIHRHRFFNTNNLWVRLDHLKSLLDREGGFIPLPVIQNEKTLDPRDPSSPGVIQLESAMGAAIECFENAGAIVVPRTRFAPVKTTSDLLAVRSDAYELTDDWRVTLVSERSGKPPTVELDSKHYKHVDQLEKALSAGVPSLRQCRTLTVKGPVVFAETNVFRGEVSVENPSGTPKPLSTGEYRDTTITL